MARSPRLRVLYVFRERKLPLLAGWQGGEEPDTLLFGFNHLHAHGVEASVHEPVYSRAGQAIARQLGRLGPDLLQLRALPRLQRHHVVFLTAGWPILLFARRVLRRPPKLIWLNLSLSTILGVGRWASGVRRCALDVRTTDPTPNTQHPTPNAHPPGRLRAALLRRALAQADRVVCVSRAQQAWLAEVTGLPKARLPFIPSGVDASFYTPPVPARDEGYILAAGRDLGRDYATFLDATRDLARPVRIVASPANLRGLALPPNAQAQLNLPPRALREAYRGAACVVVPTHGDGYPHGSDCSGTLVLLDAMATAKPAVITERHSVYDYVSPGKEALTVKPGNPAALREAIARVLETPLLAGALGAAGRAAVEQRFNTRQFATELAGVFREAVG